MAAPHSSPPSHSPPAHPHTPALRGLFEQALGEGRRISFAGDLELVTGTRHDWPYFAPWHYRGHRLGAVRFVTMLRVRSAECGVRSEEDGSVSNSSFPTPHSALRTSSSFRTPHSALRTSAPVGICVFTSPPLALAGRNRFFGTGGGWSRTRLRALSQQLVMLSRVVLHPTYRGAGLAVPFTRASCRACRWPWIETLAQLGHVHPFFEQAGFTRVDVPRRKRARSAASSRRRHSALYGGRRARVTAETARKSRYADPVYYVFDNRGPGHERRIADHADHADGYG